MLTCQQFLPASISFKSGPISCALSCRLFFNGVVVMKDLRAVSLAVFAASFVIGFTVFEAAKVDDQNKTYELSLAMDTLFPSDTSK